MTTSFQKKSKVPNIPGTRPAFQNAQLLVSTGVPSLDNIIGGGIPVGTVLLIEEDKYGTFGKLLVKYFIAEGVVSKHSVVIASQDVNSTTLVQEIPAVVDETPMHDKLPDEQMSIAWRYQNMRVAETVPSGIKFGHNYDLSKTIDADCIKKSDIEHWDFRNINIKSNVFYNPAYQDVLTHISQKICNSGFKVTSSAEHKNILRVALHCFGSPLWNTSSAELKSDLVLLMISLRALLRSAYAVCLITMPTDIFQAEGIIERCEHLSDIAIKLESFAGSDKETNPVFKDYHGLLHVRKLPAINTFACHIPESLDLAFKLKRKVFLIEKLHLPPELQDTTEREQDDFAYESPSRNLSCGSGSKNYLDF